MTTKTNTEKELLSAFEHYNALEERMTIASNTLVDLSAKQALLRGDLSESPQKIVQQLSALAAEMSGITLELDVLSSRKEALLTQITSMYQAAEADYQQCKRQHKQDCMERASELINGEYGDSLRQQLLGLAHLQGLGLESIFSDLFTHRPEGYQEQQLAAESLDMYIEPPLESSCLRAAQQIINDNRYAAAMPDLDAA